MPAKTIRPPVVPAPGSATTGPKDPRASLTGLSGRLSVPVLGVVLAAVVALSAGRLPPPPLAVDELGPWASELGPTTASFAVIRIVLAVLVVRLWAAVVVVAIARTLPRARSVWHLGPLAEALGGRIAREWVRAALGVGVASTLLIPSTAAGAETTTTLAEPPLLERVDDVVGPGEGTDPPPSDSNGAPSDSQGPRSGPPRLVLIEPQSAEPAPPSTSGPRPRGEGPSGGEQPGDGDQPRTPHSPPTTASRNGPNGRGQRPGDDGTHLPTGAAHDAPPSRSPHAGAPSDRDGASVRKDPHAGPGPWTIAPGEHLWHVAEATAAEISPGATVAEVAEYHRRLVAANAANLPVPGNPDLVYAGNVIVRPAWAPPA